MLERYTVLTCTVHNWRTHSAHIGFRSAKIHNTVDCTILEEEEEEEMFQIEETNDLIIKGET